MEEGLIHYVNLNAHRNLTSTLTCSTGGLCHKICGFFISTYEQCEIYADILEKYTEIQFMHM